jgi:hypothetical protein
LETLNEDIIWLSYGNAIMYSNLKEEKEIDVFTEKLINRFKLRAMDGRIDRIDGSVKTPQEH